MTSRITGISGSETRSYGYDTLDRLTSATASGITQTYSYDPNGNRLTETLGAQATSYNYALGSNRLQSRTQATTENYTYDPAGNLTDDGAHGFTYDDRGRMVQATTEALSTSYRYNGLGQRVSKTSPGSTTVSRRFVYDESGHLIGEYDASGAAIQETVFLGDLPIAVLSGTNGIHYVQAGQINTPRVITDSPGAAVWGWESDAFGVGTPDQDLDEDGVGFVYNSRMLGQYYDAETGLHYNYYRDYDPTLGRYVQRDPIGLAAGPNTYGYVGQEPNSYFDPSGTEAVSEINRLGWGLFPPEEQNQRNCARAAFARNYSAMRSANWKKQDKYIRCKANCEAARCGKYGYDEACKARAERESFYQFFKGDVPADSAADEAANKNGRDGALRSPNQTCKLICAPYRPRGLSPQY